MNVLLARIDIPHLGLFWFYTGSLLLLSCSIAAKFARRPGGLLLYALLVFFSLQGVVVFLLGLLGWLHGLTFLVLGIASLVAMHFVTPIQRTLRSVALAIMLIARNSWRLFSPSLLLPLLCGTALLVLYACRPTKEWDTNAFILPNIAEYVRANSIFFAQPLGAEMHYPQLWEYQYLPGFVILRGDYVSWLPGLLALLASGLAAAELTREFAPLRLRRYDVAVFWATLVWPAFLTLNRGFGSAKNDIVAAAALVAVFLALVRYAGKPSFANVVLFTLASSLLLGAKYSGVFQWVVVLAVGMVVLFGRARIAFREIQVRKLVRHLLFVIICVAVIGGPSYLRNWALFANPFYPIPLQWGESTVFPGYWDVSGTRMTDHLMDVNMWSTFLTLGEWWVGLDFGLLLAVGFLGALGLIFAGFRQKGMLSGGSHDRAVDLPNTPWAMFLIVPVLWLIFFNTYWTYGSATGEAGRYLGISLRYALGILLLAQAMLVALLMRSRRGIEATSALLAFLLVTRIWLAAADTGLLIWFFGLWLLAIVAVLGVGPHLYPPFSSVFARMRSRKWSIQTAIIAVVVVGLFGLPLGRELVRDRSWDNPLWSCVWRGYPEGQIVVLAPEVGAEMRYGFYGPRLANTVLYGGDLLGLADSASLVVVNSESEGARHLTSSGWQPVCRSDQLSLLVPSDFERP